MTIELTTVQTTVVWALVAVGVVGLLGAVLLKKIIGKVLVLALAAIVVLVLWQQRQQVLELADELRDTGCGMTPTFLGVQVSLPSAWCQPS